MKWPTDFDGAHSAQAPAVPQQTPQQFVKAALAAEREQWTGEREQFSLDDAQPAPLIDPEDRPPMAACAIAVLCFFVMAIAEVIPW